MSGVPVYGELSGRLRLFNGRFNYSVGFGLKVWFSGAIAVSCWISFGMLVNTTQPFSSLVFVTSVIRRRCNSSRFSREEYVESIPFRIRLIGF